MTSRDPTLIVRLGSARHSWAVRANNADLVRGIDFFGAAGRFLSPLAAFPAAALLRKKSADPGAVDEVACAGEGGKKEEVEEDTVGLVLLVGISGVN